MEYCLEDSTKKRVIQGGMKAGGKRLTSRNDFGHKRGEDAEGQAEQASEFQTLGGSHRVKNEIKKVIHKSYMGTKRDRDKSDHSVVEKVIDKKTEALFKRWEKNGVIQEINGCISAGKEANVYHAVAPGGKELAIKIYKVETMVFREREDYIQGEHRFRKGIQN